MNTENLTILADYLESLPEDYEGFDMGVFCRDEHDEELEPAAHTCGTSMCAVGHGPGAGLAVIEEDGDCWSSYAARVFGEYWWSKNMQFCFAGPWDVYFPTIQHAIRRLRYVAEHGAAPDNFSSTLENYGLFGDI